MLIGEYVDEAQSGRVDSRRGFAKMIRDVCSAKASFRTILVWKHDRFSRRREHAVVYKARLRDRSIRLISITEPADDSPTGKLLEAVIEGLVEFYSDNLAQEVMRGMREAASRGFWISGRSPYGYNRVMVQDGAKKRPRLEVNDTEAPLVRRMFQMADSGKSLLDITKTLNREGISSPKGKSWRKTTLYKLLTNEVYTGTMVWGANSKDNARPVRVENAFPALVPQG